MGKSLIPVHVLDWKVYYEPYLKQTETVTSQYGKLKKTPAADLTAETYSVSESSMFTVIAFMEGV